MNGAQDLGGMMGFGPISPEFDEPVFHAEWEKRALAVTIAAGACGLWSLDESRCVRESLPPAEYLSRAYYDIWISALEKLVVGHGLASQAELAAGRVSEPPRQGLAKVTSAKIAAAIAQGSPYDRPASAAAAFVVGQRVRARLMNPPGHTRLPRYVRGREGIVQAVRGVFVYPDANAQGLGENPKWLYGVRFNALDLWGAEADARSTVTVDAFEPYLEPA
jgi:nitrile hydratase